MGKGSGSKGSNEIGFLGGEKENTSKWFYGVHCFPMDLYRMFVAAAAGCIQPGLKARPIREAPG